MYLGPLEPLRNKYIPNGSYKADVFTMTVGRVISQIVPILVIPVLTRLYSPADFGVFAIFIAVTSIASFFANFRYNQAIMLPKEVGDSLRLFALAVLINFITSALFALLLLLLRDQVISWLDLESFYIVLYLMPLGMFFAGMLEPLYYLALRKRMFKGLAVTLIFKFTLIAILKIVFSLSHTGVLGLVLGHLVGSLLGVLLLVYFLIKNRAFLKFRSFIQKEGLINMAKSYKKFPLYSLPGSMLHEFSRQVPNLLLNNFFGSAVVGYFSINQKILHSPVALISGGLRDVFRERASSDYRETGSCRKIFKATFKKLALLGILPFIALFLFAPFLIPIILGPEWAPAGEYIRIMSMMYFLTYLVSPLSGVLYIVEKQAYKLVWEIFLVTSILLSFWIGFVFFDEYVAITIYSFTTSLLYIILLIISYKYTINKSK